MTPMDQMSAAKLYGKLDNTSGAMYSTVPQVVLVVLYTTLAKPKSPILQVYPPLRLRNRKIF